MKMLFYTAESPRVQQVRAEFVKEGIACEVRTGAYLRQQAKSTAELWIQNSEDCYRALKLCIERGIGFSRRSFDTDFFEPATN